MKAILAIAVTLFATSAFAGTETIHCSSKNNSDYLLNIHVDSETKRVLGAAFFNQDWSQLPEEHYQVAKAVGTSNPMVGIEVVLADNQVLDIEYSVLQAPHDGSVIVNSNDEYYCW